MQAVQTAVAREGFFFARGLDESRLSGDARAEFFNSASVGVALAAASRISALSSLLAPLREKVEVWRSRLPTAGLELIICGSKLSRNRVLVNGRIAGNNSAQYFGGCPDPKSSPPTKR